MMLQNLLDSLLSRGLSEGCFPGAVAACGARGTVYALSHVGKIAENGAEVNLDTRYDMASLSKILGPTMIALRGWEEGDFSLYDPIAKFLPGVPEDKQGINIRHLMTHTGGFTPTFRLDLALQDPADALQAILDHPLDYAPGGGPSYSCMGYIVLGKLLEAVYGKPLNVLAKERVFDPLGMSSTCYCPEGGNIASTELDAATGKLWTGVVHDENARFLRGISGNAGVFSNIHDMIRFAQMLSQEGNGYLSPATLKTAVRCQAEGGGVRRGIGFHLAGTPENYMGEIMPPTSFGHTGFTGTSLAIDPESGFFVILLSNRVCPTRENHRLFSFRRRLHNALYAAYAKES